MTAFGWIDDLARWLLRLVPRLTLVPPTHGGVVFGPRGGARERGPGLVLWWPVVQQLHSVPTCVQSWQVAARAMPLAGNEDRIVPQVTIVGLAVQYVDVVHSGTVVGILQLNEYGWSDEGFDSGNAEKTPK